MSALFVIMGIGGFVFAFGIICTLLDAIVSIFSLSFDQKRSLDFTPKTKMNSLDFTKPKLEDFGISEYHLDFVKYFEEEVGKKVFRWRGVLYLMISLLLSFSLSKGGDSLFMILFLGILYMLPVFFIMNILEIIMKALGGNFTTFFEWWILNITWSDAYGKVKDVKLANSRFEGKLREWEQKEHKNAIKSENISDKNKINKSNVDKMVKRNLYLRDSENGLLEVKIVLGYVENQGHRKEYNVFDLKRPVQGVGLIGVRSNDVFALNVTSGSNKRYAFAVYLDGVNISQRSGIHSLNEIEESKREMYNSHKGLFILPNKGSFYIDRYSQLGGANRTFTFTDFENAGINENLINDTSLKNRIEIYVWEETPEEFETVRFSMERSSCNSESDIRFSKTTEPKKEVKIGAGEATNREYKSAKDLRKPEYVGKLMFVYVEQSKLSHLGKCVVRVGKEFDFIDPMDLVPKS